MPNQLTRARRRSQSLAEPPSSPFSIKREHRGGHSRDPDAWRTRLCGEFEQYGSCCRGDACTYAHGENELRHRGSELWPLAAPQVSPDSLAWPPPPEEPRTPERTVSPSWEHVPLTHRATSAPMPMPRINSGELCVALERVAHIAVEDNELGALSPLAPAFAPSSASSSPVSPRFASPQHTPERPLRVTPHGTPTGREPPVLSPLQAPADSFDNQRPDGRLGGTVVHLSRRPGAQGWYGFVRPDQPLLRDRGHQRGDLFLHPSDAELGWRPAVGDRVSFLLGVHNGRLKAVKVCKDGSSSDSESEDGSWPAPYADYVNERHRAFSM